MSGYLDQWEKEVNEVKKKLYKEKPLAIFTSVAKDGIVYESRLEDGTKIMFRIPLNDLGESRFHPHMDAKLLARYIIVVDPIKS